jgi:hypothetical protein
MKDVLARQSSPCLSGHVADWLVRQVEDFLRHAITITAA